MILHLFHANSVVDINWHGENTLWSLFSDFFNVHTTIWGSDNDWSVEFSVHKDSEVRFSRDVEGMGDHNLLNWNTFWQSLLGSETVANHLLDILAALGRVSGEVDSSLEKFSTVNLT